jgi:hypothetical protein
MFAFLLGGWEILLILGVMIALAGSVAIVIVVVAAANAKKSTRAPHPSAPPVGSPPNR